MQMLACYAKNESRCLRSLPGFVLLRLLTAFLELFCLFVCLFYSLADLALLLTGLDTHGEVLCCATLAGFGYSSFGVIPVICSGSDLVSKGACQSYSCNMWKAN